MRIQYFADTDTLCVEFTDGAVEETKDINENTVIDLDSRGNLVALTVEHAQGMIDFFNLSFQQVTPVQELTAA